MTSAPDSLPDDIAALKALVLSERAARLGAEAEAQLRAIEIETLKLQIAKLRRERDLTWREGPVEKRLAHALCLEWCARGISSTAPEKENR